MAPFRIPARALRLFTAVGLIGACLAVAAAPAAAESPAVADCRAHNKLTHHYTPAELRQALATMPSTVQEYTDCYQVIQNQLYEEIGSKGGHATTTSSGGGGVSTPILIIVIVIILGGGGFAYTAYRRNQGESADSPDRGD